MGDVARHRDPGHGTAPPLIHCYCRGIHWCCSGARHNRPCVCGCGWLAGGGWGWVYVCGRRRAAPRPRAWYVLISQKVFIKSFCKSQFPHKSVNLFFILVIINTIQGPEVNCDVANSGDIARHRDPGHGTSAPNDTHHAHLLRPSLVCLMAASQSHSTYRPIGS